MRGKAIICKNCESPLFVADLKRKYCSTECYREFQTARLKRRAKEMREINKELHRCTYCGEDNDGSKFQLCAKCRRYMRLQHDKKKSF